MPSLGHRSLVMTQISDNGLPQLLQDVAELGGGQAGRAARPPRTAARSIESKQHRATLGSMRSHASSHSPTGDNRTRDALSHAEVITMTCRFPGREVRSAAPPGHPLSDPAYRREPRHEPQANGCAARRRGGVPRYFLPWSFGDMMRRIYADVEESPRRGDPRELGAARKRMNHRCPTRVIEAHQQNPHDEGSRGTDPAQRCRRRRRPFVRCVAGDPDKTVVEAAIAARMAEITGDQNWAAGSEGDQDALLWSI